MDAPSGTSPLSQSELVDRYFMEHRVQVLDLAAFLDRVARARVLDAEDDFRMRSLREAMAVLSDGEGDRVRRVQMVFSDPSTELLPSLDRKSATGAFDPGA